MIEESEILKIIEIMALVGSILIIAAGMYRQTFVSVFSNWLQLNEFKIQNWGSLTSEQKTNIQTQINDLDTFRYNQQQMSVWIAAFGFTLTTFSLILLVYSISKLKKHRYFKIVMRIFLIIFLLFYIFFLVKKIFVFTY
jgi:hypothetical protein